MKTLVLLVANVALLVSFLTLTRKKKDEQHHLQTRWSHDNSHLRDITQDHIHPWMNNAWYRYIHDSTPRKDCYVCSYMPPTTQYATLYAKAMDIIQANLSWKHGNLSHSLCYRQENGSTPMGNTTNCKAVQTHAPGGPVKSNNISNGTFWVQGMAWLCGQRAYFILPGNWTGQCAPIFISDHTFKITMDEFKLWTERQKRSGLFLNASCKIDDEQDQEIDALRIAVMQHRVALDMILAEKGGLSVLFNNTCCTYIPDNVHSSNMTDALKTLRQLRDAQQRDYATNTEDWPTWLLSGSWKSLLIKGLVFVGVIILLLCLFTSCVIPCLKNMVSKMVTASIHAYITLSQNEEDDNEIDTWI
uniref:Uncharacterized protein n=1 Tax=Oreochromis aureus TaxID=47969 RepID=A0AAZ1WVX1_OREAU